MAFKTVTLSRWDEIHALAKHGWLYRGQREATWLLQTSLERCCDRHAVTSVDRPMVERELLREFRRTYHQYATHVPAASASLEWLSLMQHHGAPTRLLDFTYSIYVAAYFALEAGDGDAAVWAFEGPWALQTSLQLLGRGGRSDLSKLREPFQEGHEAAVGPLFFDEPYVCTACPLNPFRLNERLRVQKGAFLVPADVTASFMTNLEAMPGHDSVDHLLKIVLPTALRDEGLHRLYLMNVSRTSLFPGLDGFAQSLGVFHSLFAPVRWV